MADLNRDDMLKLAKLARLEITEDEIVEYLDELNSILEYVKQLQTVDTEGLQPTNQVTDLTNVTRKDIPKDYGYSLTELMSNIPKVKDGLIKVKRMIE